VGGGVLVGVALGVGRTVGVDVCALDAQADRNSEPMRKK
jgi:hypothetical protein